MAGEERFEAGERGSRRVLFLIILATLAFTALLVFLGLTSSGSDRYYLLGLSILMVACGVWVAAIYAARVSHEGPAVAVGREGVSMFGVGLVPWEEIEELVLFESHGLEFVGFRVRDRRRVMRGAALGHRLTSWQWALQHKVAIALAPETFGRSAAEFVEILLSHRDLPVDDRR